MVIMNKTKCDKCNSTKNVEFSHLNRNKGIDINYCLPCKEIRSEGYHTMCPGSLTTQGEYIWKDGIKDNGIKWYKEARDKLIIKWKIRRKKIKQEIKEEKLKTKEAINKW